MNEAPTEEELEAEVAEAVDELGIVEDQPDGEGDEAGDSSEGGSDGAKAESGDSAE